MLEQIAAEVPGIVENPSLRRKAALGVIGLVLLINGIFFASVYNAWLGPFDVEPATLVGLESPPLKRWVRLVDGKRMLTHDDLTNTGIVEERIGRRGTSMAASFLVLEAGGKELLVRSSDSAGNQGLVGVLVKNPGHYETSDYGPVILDLDADYGVLGWAVSILGALVIAFALDQIRRSYVKPRVMPPPLS